MPLDSSIQQIVTGLRSTDSRAAHALPLVLAASIGTILVAYGFEYIGKYRPCPLCLIERYAYYFAIAASIAGLLGARMGAGSTWLRIILAAIAIGYLVNMGLGIHHSGVEWKWWPGPTTCTGALPKLSGGIDLDQPVIRCDEASWRFAGLSFAGWNAVLSAALAIFAAWAACGGRRKTA